MLTHRTAMDRHRAHGVMLVAELEEEIVASRQVAKVAEVELGPGLIQAREARGAIVRIVHIILIEGQYS